MTSVSISSSISKSISVSISGEFLPTDISNLFLWLDADDSSTITEVAGVLSKWDDKSANGFDAIQNTESKKPLFVTGVLNGKPVVRSDGIDDNMDLGVSAKFGANDNVTMFFVSTNLPIGSGTRIFDTNQFFLRKAPAGDTWEIEVSRTGGNTRIGSNTDTSKSHQIVEITYDQSTLTIQNNNINFASVAAAGPINIPGNNSRLFSNTFAAFFATADIAEVVMYDKLLSTGELNQVRTYLADKWGL